MRALRSKRLLVLLAVFALSGVVVVVALAAVTSRQVYVEGSGLRFRFERVTTDASGFDSGWHIHPGLVIVQIESGSVQFTQGSCTPRTFGPGETIIEVPWRPARFVATGATTWTTTLFVATNQEFTVPLTRYSPAQANPCP